MDKVLLEKELPIKMVAFGRCFRTEAGAAGAAGKGLYRVHQFTKVHARARRLVLAACVVAAVICLQQAARRRAHVLCCAHTPQQSLHACTQHIGC